MPKHAKLNCLRISGIIHIDCPECGGRAALDEEQDYTIDAEGHVFPQFVCQNRESGKYCEYSGLIQIRNP